MITDKRPDCSILIVNWNTRDLTMRCLKSVFETAGDMCVEVFLVDNGSTDGSVDAIRECFPNVSVITNASNVGFSKANNQAIKNATGRNVLLLNSDTELLPNALGELINALDADRIIAAAGPMLLNPDGSVQPSCGSFPNLWSEFLFQSFLYKILPSPFPLNRRIHPLQQWKYRRKHFVDWIGGAAMAIPSVVFQRVGFLDESSFMYGEDMDWCWRARSLGYEIQHCPKASVIHESAASRRNYKRWIRDYTEATLSFFLHRRSGLSYKIASIMVVLGSAVRVFMCFFGKAFFRSRSDELQQRAAGYKEAMLAGWYGYIGGSADVHVTHEGLK